MKIIETHPNRGVMVMEMEPHEVGDWTGHEGYEGVRHYSFSMGLEVSSLEPLPDYTPAEFPIPHETILKVLPGHSIHPREGEKYTAALHGDPANIRVAVKFCGTMVDGTLIWRYDTAMPASVKETHFLTNGKGMWNGKQIILFRR